MKQVFDNINKLDEKCYKKYLLSEDILMENASQYMNKFIRDKFKKKSKVLIVAGSGNNGADGIALARELLGDYKVALYITNINSKSKMFRIQLNRFFAIGGKVTNKIQSRGYDIVVDAIFGSGLSRELDKKTIKLIDNINKISTYKIACDIPSGIQKNAILSKSVFVADTTITMGAINSTLLNDKSKDFVGDILVADLGVSRAIYEGKSNIFMLEKSDLKLPNRDKKLVNKGSFGHSYIVSGDKSGAAILSALACEKFGSGLTSIYSKKTLLNTPYSIMNSLKINKNISALAIGMGLGDFSNDKNIDKMLKLKIPKVIDADLFKNIKIKKILKQKNIVCLPHPKEFISLLKIACNINISIDNLQSNRLKYLKIFSKQYPKIVLLLKGSNSIITYKNRFYISTIGEPSLAKGGSGDVLAGMVLALLSQGYKPLDAAINALLAHQLTSNNLNINSFSLTPNSIINKLETISLINGAK